MNDNSNASISTAATSSELIHAYGLFLVAWSVLESVMQAAIQKELGVSATKVVIVTGKMQFYPRAQLLISLLKLEKEKNKDAIDLLNRIEVFAKRNSIVHGLIIVGVPGKFSFVKYDGGGSSKHTFTADELTDHALEVNRQTAKLQNLLQVSDKDIQAVGNATLGFVKKS